MSVKYKDYYQILGVSRDASQDEIRKKYRKLASKHHPDRNPDDKSAEEKFKEIGEAYEVLKDPEKRKLYDQVGSDWKRYEQAGASADDFDWSRYARSGQGQRVNVNFEDLFGGGQRGRQSGGSPFSSFFETIFGGGDPFAGGRQQQGRQYQYNTGGRASAQKGRDSEAEIPVDLKDLIHGVEKQFRINGERVKVKIPAGIEDGKRLKLKGKGHVVSHGGTIGDLYLKVKVNEPEGFERRGKDIYQKVPLDVYTAVLGGNVTVETLQGKVKLTIPPETENGKVFRLSGRGLPDMKKTGKRGDYFIKVEIDLPKNLSEKEKELFKELAKRRKG